jgi:hypothetical protein
LGWIDVLTGIIPHLKSTIGGLDAIFDQVIGEHETEKIDDDQPNRLDFVHILLRLQKNNMLDFELTKDNLKAILLVSTTKKHIIFYGTFLTFWTYWNVKNVFDVSFLTFLEP